MFLSLDEFLLVNSQILNEYKKDDYLYKLIKDERDIFE
tara:strand:- start:1489 stop:1602 length:114 start_codon:yes stop_codon:yes gene_type:complete